MEVDYTYSLLRLYHGIFTFSKVYQDMHLWDVHNGNENNSYFITPELAQRLHCILHHYSECNHWCKYFPFISQCSFRSRNWVNFCSAVLYIHNQTSISYDDSPFFLSHPVFFLLLFLSTLLLQEVNKIKIKITAYLMEFIGGSDKVLLSMEIIIYAKWHLKVIKYTLIIKSKLSTILPVITEAFFMCLLYRLLYHHQGKH